MIDTIVAYFRVLFYNIICCRENFDVNFLKLLEINGVMRQPDMDTDPKHYNYPATKKFLAYAQRKQELQEHPRGNPDNIKALLIYKISHGCEESEGRGEAGVEGPLCPGCGGPVNWPKRRQLLRRIHKGHRLEDLQEICNRDYDKFIRECDAFVGTHLTREEVCLFVGHEVNFDEQADRIDKIYNEIEDC